MKTNDLHPRTAALLDLSLKNLTHGYLFVGRDEERLSQAAIEFLASLYSNFGASKKNIALIRAETHQSILRIAANEAGRISLAAVREALTGLNLTAPASLPYRLFLIPSAAGLSAEAANSLLKALEEPPKGVIFVLTTTSSDRLLPTVVSRLRVIDFLPVAADRHQNEQFATVVDNFINGGLSARFAIIYKLHQQSRLGEFVIALGDGVHRSSLVEPAKFAVLEQLIRAEELIGSNVSPRLVCEAIALEMSL